MVVLSERAVQEYRQRKDGLTLRSARIAYWSPTAVQFISEVPAFLSSVRVMQNQMLGMIGQKLGSAGKLPSSINDFARLPAKYRLPREHRELIVKYWNDGGTLVKHYRDLDQHFTVIAQHTYIKTEVPERLLVFLPDNPEVKSPAKFTFRQEREALPYCVGTLQKFNEVMNQIAILFGFQEAPLQQTLNMGDQGDVVPGQKRTMGLLIEETTTFRGFEIGHTEDQRAYITKFGPKLPDLPDSQDRG
jgi:hypothetical protein